MKFICALLLIYSTDALLVDSKESPYRVLHDKLLKNYDKNTRPIFDQNSNITVFFGLSIKHLDVDENAQTMILSTNLVMNWKDEYLQWGPEDNSNIKSLQFDNNDVWTPDVALYNSAAKAAVTPVGNWHLRVTNTGNTTWIPPFTAEVPCQLDLYNWPSDSHKCIFKFGSWAHHGGQLDLRSPKHSPISFEHYEPNGQWKLAKFKVKRNTATYLDTYFDLDFEVTIQRFGISRVRYISHSTLAVLVTVLLAYVLPIHFHLSRLLIHIFALSILIICDFVLFMTLPGSSGRVPHVVSYFSGTIVLTSLSLIINIIMITSYFSSGPQKILRKRIASILPFSRRGGHSMSEEVGYMHLAEEMVTVEPGQTPRNSISGESVNAPSANDINSTNPNADLKEMYKKLTLFKVINCTMFCLFALAYSIDYMVLLRLIDS